MYINLLVITNLLTLSGTIC